MRDLFGYIVLGGLLVAVVAVLYLPIYFRLRNRVSLIRQVCFVGLVGTFFAIVFATLLLDIISGIQMGNLFHPTTRNISLAALRI